MNKIIKIISFFIVTLFLSSCAIEPPAILQISETDNTVSPDFPELKSIIGKTVRWGGIIIDVKNNEDNTQITILGYPLDEQARPFIKNQNESRRFVAHFNRFIEPNSYSLKRKITVIGKLDRIEENKVGEFKYEIPVILVDRHVLWPDRSQNSDEYYDDYNYRGYGYYPFYYPYYSHYWNYGRHYPYRHYY